jgi:hypothetical protein
MTLLNILGCVLGPAIGSHLIKIYTDSRSVRLSTNNKSSEVPSTTHPLGIRPAGEGGTVPALAVIINAIVDALAEFGVRHIEMPATPENVWRAINAARP